ncbi:MAG: signal recognition particle-docking protein FtsY [Nitrospirota bacterium]|nr:signal recognition particle-docking protein FtsY [Nitrospirota bacterium]
MGFFTRLLGGLSGGGSSDLGRRLAGAAQGHARIDSQLLEEVEEILITADMGPAVTRRFLQTVDNEVRHNRLTDPTRMWQILRDDVLRTVTRPGSGGLTLSASPTVVMVVGVNGVGKTTTIGKLAAHFTRSGKKVVLAAGDTFRAAAGEQLSLWGQKLGVDVIRQPDGADAAAVAFDACQAAVARGADLLLVDTAGRLHTNVNLMAELEKVQRVIGKAIPGAPHEVLLVLDANTGQNALSQAASFCAGAGVTGLVLTKMDSSARGGVLVNLVETYRKPVRFIGVGEGADDLRPFDAEAYVAALFASAADAGGGGGGGKG